MSTSLSGGRRVAVALFSLHLLGVSATLAQTGTALVRHAPSINGTIDGSVQQMTAEAVALNGGGLITADWRVPGSPAVQLNGHPSYDGTVDGTGALAPSDYQITLNGSASLHHIIRRTDPVILPVVAAPPQPTGTRSVAINATTDSPGNYLTLRDLTLNGNVGQFAIPAGTYGDFTANSGSGFTLGVPGATSASVYNLQRLTLNGQAQIQILGPVILTVANGFAVNGAIGNTAHPEWLSLQIYSIGLTLNGGSSVYAGVSAPNGTVTISGNSVLTGAVICDRLFVNGAGVLRVAPPSASNQAPVANDQSVQLNEDTTAAVTLIATDANGDSLQYSTVTPPAHGSLTGSAPNLTYTPQPNYNGSDSFTFQANDGQAYSNIATVSITIAPTNDAPVAASISVALDEDNPTAITLAGSDVDSSALSYAYTNPAHGSVTGTAPNLTYTPGLNFNGTDSFTYTVFDGQLTSAPALVSIVIRPVDDPPVAQNQTVSVPQSGSVAVQLTASDVDSPPSALTFAKASDPAHGTLSGSPPNLVYTPAPGFGGTDSFTFTAYDGQLTSAPATVTINVSPNRAPIVANASAQTAEDTSISLTLTGTDADADPLTFAIVANPQHGTLSALSAAGGAAATVVYTPSKDYNGPDSFTFKANDTKADSNVATFSLNVTPMNDAPVAADQTVQLNEDTSAVVILSASDVDSPALTFRTLSLPAHGTLGPITAGPNNTAFITYTPASNYNGPDKFTFVANDAELDSVPATVTIAVQPVNDPPVADAGAVRTPEDTPLTLTLTGSDIDSPSFTFAIIDPPRYGTLSALTPGPNNTATIVYTPGQDFNGADGFTFVANDGAASSAPATMVITVTPVNDPPVADGGPVLSTVQGTPKSFTLLATDVDHDSLTYVIDTPPAHGTLSGAAPNLNYAPDAGYRGDDFLTFHATDGQASSNEATVNFHIVAVNHAPVAANGSVTLNEDTPTTLSLSATDSDGDSLFYVVLTPPQHGTLGPITVAANGTASVLYTPTKDFNGTDTLALKANDGQADSNIASIAITVNPVNDAPVAAAASFTTDEDTPITATLTATDVDGDPLTYSIVTPPGHGTLGSITIANGIATATYTPAKDYNGTDNFTFKANDGQADSNVATVSLTIKPVNDAPVAATQSVTCVQNSTVAVTLSATDVDSASLTYTILSPPQHGTFTGSPPNLIYKPATNFAGADSLTFVANDGSLSSNVATVPITVQPLPTTSTLTVIGGTDTVLAGDTYQVVSNSAPAGTIFAGWVVNSGSGTFGDPKLSQTTFAAAPQAATTIQATYITLTAQTDVNGDGISDLLEIEAGALDPNDPSNPNNPKNTASQANLQNYSYDNDNQLITAPESNYKYDKEGNASPDQK